MSHDRVKRQGDLDQDSSEVRTAGSRYIPEATVDALHEVADVCRDAQDLLSVAATRLRSKTTTEVCDALLDMARRHADMVEDLREEAVRLGGKRTATGTIGGAARRLYAVADATLSDNRAEVDTLLRHLSRMEERAAVRIRRVRSSIALDEAADKIDGVLGRVELARAGLDSLLGNRTE